MSEFAKAECAPCPVAKRVQTLGTPRVLLWVHALWRPDSSYTHTMEKGEVGRIGRGRAGGGGAGGGGTRGGEEPSHTALRVPGPKTSRTNKGSRVGSKKVPVSSTHVSHCCGAGYGDRAGVSGPRPGRGSSPSAFPGRPRLELPPPHPPEDAVTSGLSHFTATHFWLIASQHKGAQFSSLGSVS